jgi:hypothetical protein
MYRRDDTKWKFWFHTNLLIAGGLFVTPELQYWAVLLSAYQLMYFACHGETGRHKEVQLRAGFLILHAIGFMPSFGFVHYLLLASTSVSLALNSGVLTLVTARIPSNQSGGLIS